MDEILPHLREGQEYVIGYKWTFGKDEDGEDCARLMVKAAQIGKEAK